MMADLFLSSESQNRKSCFANVRDDKMEKLLYDLKDDSRENSRKEIVAGFTKAHLLEFRRKLFDVAVKKVESRSNDKNIPWDELSDTEQKPSSWELRNRKTKPSVADDTIDLALFIKGSHGSFPMQMIRPSTAKEKSGHVPDCKDAEFESCNSSSDQSVFDETQDAPNSQDKRNCNSSEAGSNPTSERVERFVIRETERIPCDAGNQCDFPVEIIPLSESATSTDDLVHLTSASTQTETSMFHEANDSDSSGGSFNEDLTEKGTAIASAPKPDHPENDSIRSLRARCESAEKMLAALDKRHRDEINECRRVQAAIRKDLNDNAYVSKESSNPRVSTLPKSQPEATMDLTANPEFILTQDSQGEPVYTKPSIMHLELARKGVFTSSDGRQSSIAAQPDKTPNSVINATSRDASANYNGASNTPNPMQSRVPYDPSNKPQPNFARMQSVNVKHFDARQTRATQVIMGNAKRWEEKRVLTQNASSARRRDEQLTKRRKMNDPVPSTSNAPSFASQQPAVQSTSTAISDRSAAAPLEPTKPVPNTAPISENRQSYSDVAEQARWLTAMNKSTKKKESRAKRVVTPLSGPDDAENVELFVNGLNCKRFKSQKDLEESVKFHCADRGVDSIYQRVIAFRIGRSKVGCKLVVKEQDEAAVRAADFWPKGVVVREWYEHNPNSRSSSSDRENEDSN